MSASVASRSLATSGVSTTGKSRPKRLNLAIPTSSSSASHSYDELGLPSLASARGAADQTAFTNVRSQIARVPEAYRDPSEHILSGKGSTLQHARSVYAAGPIEVLPGLFLGDEHNAQDMERLAELNITMILDVAKETSLPVSGSEIEEAIELQGAGNEQAHAQRTPAHFLSLRIPHQKVHDQPTASSKSPLSAKHHLVLSGMTTYRSPDLDAPFHTPLSAFGLPTPASAYFTPPTTAYPSHLFDEPPKTPAATTRTPLHAPSSAAAEGESATYLRNTWSTPNLHRYDSKGRDRAGGPSGRRPSTSTTARDKAAQAARERRRNRRSGAGADSLDDDEREGDTLSSDSDRRDTLTENDDEGAMTSASSKPTSPELTPDMDVHGPLTPKDRHVQNRRRSQARFWPKPGDAGSADGAGPYREEEYHAHSRTSSSSSIASSAIASADDDGNENESTLQLRDHRGRPVYLPANATALLLHPHSSDTAFEVGNHSTSATTKSAIKYIKLPWTHDETDLAAPGGGFTQGCAIIADALGLPPRLTPSGGVRSTTTRRRLINTVTAADDDDQEAEPATPRRRGGGGAEGGVLVHCQCGVSRSATLVIAFVMQAAALMYGFEGLGSLTGMHDCYNLVKDKSASISPNCSLIYQLVEWERFLSAEASKLRDATATAKAAKGSTSVRGHGGRGWSSEVMDEEEWSRMRLEEERKEAAEEERVRQARLVEAVEAARRRAREEQEAAASSSSSSGGAPDSGEGSGSGLVASGLGARRKKKAPALTLGVPKAGAANGVGSRLAGGMGAGVSSAPGLSGEMVSGDVAADAQVPPTPSIRTALPPRQKAARTRPAHLRIDPAALLTKPLTSLSLDASEAPKDRNGAAQPLSGQNEFGADRQSPRLQDTQRTPTHSRRSRDEAMPASASLPLTTNGLSRRSSARRVSHRPSESVGGGATAAAPQPASPPPPHRRNKSVQYQAGGGASLMTKSASAHSPPTSSFVGAAAQSPADRKELHRRTFSSEWPPPVLRDVISQLAVGTRAAGPAPAAVAAESVTAVGTATASTAVDADSQALQQ